MSRPGGVKSKMYNNATPPFAKLGKQLEREFRKVP